MFQKSGGGKARSPLTVVLDMDETLVHSRLELHCAEGNVSINDPRQAEDRSKSLEEPEVQHDFEFAIPLSPVASHGELFVRVHKRPGLDAFLEEASSFCNLAVFTAGTEDYARTLLDLLDPCGRMNLRLFRDSCSIVDGLFLKDLNKVKQELSRTVLIDNSPVSMLLQPDNAILVSSFYTDRNDNALYKLLPILRGLHHMDDIRPYLVQEFALRAALEHSGYDLTDIASKHEILTRDLECSKHEHSTLVQPIRG